jgi:hypothetical protein
MALLPLNQFKTKTSVIKSSSTSTVYTAPIGVTAIILMTQITNISTETHTVTFEHYRNLPVLPDAQGNGAQSSSTVTKLVQDYIIPPADAASLTMGKLIVESLDSVRCYADADNVFNLTLSVLETANA